MGQIFSNLAKSTLASAITTADLSFNVVDGSSFPIANNGNNALNHGDWFKATLSKKDNSSYEIIYVRTHTNGSTTFNHVLRGQEGTSAQNWDDETVVSIRITADDSLNWTNKSELTLGNTSSTAMAGNKTAADIGGVPSTRTINTKPLSTDINLSATDVGARGDTWVPAWGDITGKPTVIAAGVDAASARSAIGAGTSNLVIGSAVTEAMAGNTFIPSTASDVNARPDNWNPAWGDIAGKPPRIAAGDTKEEARDEIEAAIKSSEYMLEPFLLTGNITLSEDHLGRSIHGSDSARYTITLPHSDTWEPPAGSLFHISGTAFSFTMNRENNVSMYVNGVLTTAFIGKIWLTASVYYRGNNIWQVSI